MEDSGRGEVRKADQEANALVTISASDGVKPVSLTEIVQLFSLIQCLPILTVCILVVVSWLTTSGAGPSVCDADSLLFISVGDCDCRLNHSTDVKLRYIETWSSASTIDRRSKLGPLEFHG